MAGKTKVGTGVITGGYGGSYGLGYASGVYVAYDTYNESITGNARIERVESATLAGNARLERVESTSISGSAFITSSFVTVDTTILGNARVERVFNASITGLSRVERVDSSSLTGNASIIWVKSEDITGSAGSTNYYSPAFYVAEAGEKFLLYTDNKYNFFSKILEFDNNSDLRSVVKDGWSSGKSVLYTVPAGKNATTLSARPTDSNNGDYVFRTTNFRIFNKSGATVAIRPSIVPDGEIADSDHYTSESYNIASSTTASYSMDFAAGLASGDSIYMEYSNAASAGDGVLFFNVVERDNT